MRSLRSAPRSCPWSKESAKTSPERGQLALASRRAARSRHVDTGVRQMSCDKNRIRHRMTAHRDNPRRAEPVGFPRRPARSVAADQVNVACCQATPWLDFPGALRATRPRARPRFPLAGAPPARGRTESEGASTNTRILLPSRTGPREDRAGRPEDVVTRGRNAPTNAAARAIPPRRNSPSNGPARPNRTSRSGVPLPSETTRGPSISNRSRSSARGC